jgi:hypothetical protein
VFYFGHEIIPGLPEPFGNIFILGTTDTGKKSMPGNVEKILIISFKKQPAAPQPLKLFRKALLIDLNLSPAVLVTG